MVGVMIVATNASVGQAEPVREQNKLDSYLGKVLSRMDAVSGQLSAWGNIDIRQHR